MNLKARVSRLEDESVVTLRPAIIFSFNGILDEIEARRKHEAESQGREIKIVNFKTVQ